MQDLNFDAFYNTLHHEVSTSTAFEASLQRMLSWGEEQIPHKSWQSLKALDFSTEVARVEPWLSRTLKRAPCPFSVKGVYFGLGERANKSKVEFADLYFALMGQCDLSDPKFKWLWGNLRHYPNSAYLRSEPLKAGSIICNEDEENGLSTPGYILFSLSFSALLLKAALNSSIYNLLGANEPIGLVLGFDSGDLLRLGSLQANGLVVNTKQAFS